MKILYIVAKTLLAKVIKGASIETMTWSIVVKTLLAEVIKRASKMEALFYSTVTDFAKFLGLSTFRPFFVLI